MCYSRPRHLYWRHKRTSQVAEKLLLRSGDGDAINVTIAHPGAPGATATLRTRRALPTRPASEPNRFKGGASTQPAPSPLSARGTRRNQPRKSKRIDGSPCSSLERQCKLCWRNANHDCHNACISPLRPMAFNRGIKDTTKGKYNLQCMFAPPAHGLQPGN